MQNSDARYRSTFYQVPNARPSDAMPDWLRSQFTQTGVGTGTAEDGSRNDSWLAPNHFVRDSQGRSVVLLGDDGQLEGTNDLAFNDGYNAQRDSYYDPDLGRVTAASNVNQQPFERAHARNRGIAAAVIGSMIGANALTGGMGDLGGFFGGGDVAVPGNLPPLEPTTIGELGGGVDAAGGMPFTQSEIPSLSDLGVDPTQGGGTFEGTGWTPESPPSGFDPSSLRNVRTVGNIIRGLMGGGQGSRSGTGAGQGSGNGLGGLGGSSNAYRIGDHKQDTDPYGLRASGWGGGFVQDPKQKVAQAMMDLNPWRFEA